MVAFLAGLCTLLLFGLMGAWATIVAKNERIAELEAVQARTAPPVNVLRMPQSVEPRTMQDLPPLFPMEGNDEPTRACRIKL